MGIKLGSLRLSAILFVPTSSLPWITSFFCLV
uniref:Uncharacterized protein n=1 Tax=Arundo donax TaxID=35708 RepID=A0A0A8YQH8_ARUDO